MFRSVKQTIKAGEFLKSVPISKVDEAKQEAWGIFTAEVPDSDDEIADYEYQKGKVQAWSDDAKTKAAAAGQEESLGNVRFDHTILATGKVIALNMDDAAKQIGGGTYLMNVGDTKTWDMVAKGILQGFSFGGRYDWRKCDACGRDLPLEQGNNFCDTCGGNQKVRYGATIAELSVCDRPAVPVANILHIKADGSTVHQKVEATVDKTDEAKTKKVAGEELKSSAFAYVGDESDPSTWKFPLHFSTKEKSARHVRNALARFNQAKGIPADKKTEVKAKILAAAKQYGVEVSEDEEKAEVVTLDRSFLKAEVQHIKQSFFDKATASGITLRKDLYDVATMAELLQRIAWLRYSAINERDYEGDDSEVPEELEENLISLSDTFLAMAREETAELVSAAKKAGKVTTMEKAIELPAEVGELLTAHVVDTAAHHEALADAHKAMGEDHTENAKTHKAIHEHFKKAAEDGGEMAEHHAMHADAHKAIMEHHLTKAAHHEAMHKAHSEMAAKCAKMAETFADTPEKKTALTAQFKAIRDARPAVGKAAPVAINVDKMSTSEKSAFDAVNNAWLNSDEYKKMATDALRKQTIAKLNSTANGAAIVVGVEAEAENVYAVPRPGQSNKSADFAEGGGGSSEIFDIPVLI